MGGFYHCPCCGLPTLEDDWFDTCMVCQWEDDGQSDETASRVELGPNAPYSLAAARANHADYGHMYARDDPKAPPSDAMRDRLLAIARAVPFDTAAYAAWLAEWRDWSC